MNRLENKVAIITGCASGMGLAAVKLFLSEGAKVTATDVAFEQMQDALSEYKDNSHLIQIKLDITNEKEWEYVVNETVKQFNTIDILVNNAGVSLHADLLNQTKEGFNKQIDLNLTATWLGMNKVIPTMIQNGGGSIVNCGSMSAFMGSASKGSIAYAAAKSGLIALAREAAWTYGKDHIRVNTVHPGNTYTGAAKRYGCPSVEALGMAFKDETPLPPHAAEDIDIANAYLFFASDESKFVTGQSLCVDGGYNCR